MKLLTTISVLVAILHLGVFAEQDYYASGTASRYNSIFKGLVEVELDYYFDEFNSCVYVYYNESFYRMSLAIDGFDREELNAILDKYLEWRQKAIEKEVKIEKAIDSLHIKIWLEFGDEWHSSCKDDIRVLGTFFSQSTKRHQLVLSFREVQSCTNDFVSHNPEQLYFEYEEVMLLKNYLDGDTLQKVREKIKKKRAIEDEFD